MWGLFALLGRGSKQNSPDIRISQSMNNTSLMNIYDVRAHAYVQNETS